MNPTGEELLDPMQAALHLGISPQLLVNYTRADLLRFCDGHPLARADWKLAKH